MADIKYFALGGQDERAKYCGILEINDQIFILNAGIGDDISNQYGISKVIPDLNYIQKNKHKVVGIFVGTPQFLNIGALPFILEHLKNIPIYTSRVGEIIINSWFKRKSKSENFAKNLPRIKVCGVLRDFGVGNIAVCAFKVFNSMPDSYGWVFKTNDGCVVFVDEFIIENKKLLGFESQLHLLPKITNNKVLALIVGLQNVNKVYGYTAPNYNTYNFLKKSITNSANRVIVACYDNDLLTILNVVKIAKIYGMKLVVYSNTLIRLFQLMVKLNYINMDQLNLIDSKRVSNESDLLVLITGNYDRLYYKMHKILTGQDINIDIVESDTYILSTITQPGLELREAKLLDEVNRHNCITKKIGSNVNLAIAGKEDQMFLANILNPKFIYPIMGYFKEFSAYNEALETIISPHKIRFLYNGEVAIIKNGIAQKNEHYDVGEQYVDADGVLDIKTSILLERQSMYTHGLIVINSIYNKKNHCFSLPIIHTEGLISFDHEKNADIDKLLIKIAKDELEKNLALTPNKIINVRSLKIQLKKAIQRVIERQLQKKPMVLVGIGQI